VSVRDTRKESLVILHCNVKVENKHYVEGGLTPGGTGRQTLWCGGR
jgi:hypothetical protein